MGKKFQKDESEKPRIFKWKVLMKYQWKDNDALLPRDFQGNMNYWSEDEVWGLVIYFTLNDSCQSRHSFVTHL